jgi:hypothetical protein
MRLSRPFSVALACAVLVMSASAQQIINVGANPNDSTGDPARTAFIKTNTNFQSAWGWSLSCTPPLSGCGLVSNGLSLGLSTVPVTVGGTGATSLTGLLKGNGTSPVSAADVTAVTVLFAGTCDASHYLRGDGQCAAQSGAGTVTSVGLTMPAVFAITGGPVTGSGTFAVTASGNSGGWPYFDTSGTLASTPTPIANQLLYGGGAGTPPGSLSPGTSTTILHGNAAGTPSWGAVNLSTDVSNTLQAAQMPALTGDVTSAGATYATTISPAAVTLAKQANLAAYSIQGNNTSSGATPAALNPLQALSMMSGVFNVTAVATANVATLSGSQTIDGQTLGSGAALQSVLLTGQTTASQNGPWMVQTGAWTRPPNWPSGYALAVNCDIAVFVRQGSSNQGHTFRLSTGSAITVDTTSETWTDATAAGGGSGVTSLTAGTGLTASPSTITATGSYSLTTPVTATNGGTGEAGTITGVLMGNGTSAHTAATAAQIITPFGSGSSTNYLRGDGTVATPQSVAYLSYDTGNVTTASLPFGGFQKVSNASTVDNLDGTTIAYSCSAAPTITLYDCGTSTTCGAGSRTAIGTIVFAGSNGTATDGTITHSGIAAGDYVAWATTAGTCTTLNFQVHAQVHTN